MLEPSGSVVITEQRQTGCIVTLLWFILIGWWLSAIWSTIAWFLIILIIPMPIGLVMLNYLPKIATLREPTAEYSTTIDGTIVSVQATGIRQRPFLLRAIYFILVGWWFCLLWLSVAWLASITLIGLPFAIWMYNRVPAITTLRRY